MPELGVGKRYSINFLTGYTLVEESSNFNTGTDYQDLLEKSRCRQQVISIRDSHVIRFIYWRKRHLSRYCKQKARPIVLPPHSLQPPNFFAVAEAGFLKPLNFFDRSVSRVNHPRKPDSLVSDRHRTSLRLTHDGFC